MTPIRLIVFTAAVVVSLVACDSESPKKEGAKKNSTASLAERLLGYWVPDEDAYFEMLKHQSTEPLEAGEVTERELKQVAQQDAAESVVAFNADSSTTSYSGGYVEQGEFKIVSTRPDSGELDVDLIDAEGRVDEATIVIRDSQLILKGRVGKEDVGKPEILFLRTDAEEFQARLSRADRE